MPFPTSTWIEKAEEELKVVFPSLFKAKMMSRNGGEISFSEDDWILFPFFDKSNNKTMSRTCNHVALETKSARTWPRFPKDAIAIGSNGCGDYLVLLPKKNTADLLETIYIWRHEDGEITVIADNILKFEKP